MKSISLILLFSLSLSTIGCSTQSTSVADTPILSDTTTKQIIKFTTEKGDLKRAENLAFAKQHVDSSKVIALSSKEHPIGEIRTLKYYQNNIYVFDKKGTGALLIYTKDGNLLNYLPPKGNGPKEFSELMDFTINIDLQELIILDIYLQKLLFYSLDGNYLREERINFGAGNLEYWKDGILLLETSSYDDRYSYQTYSLNDHQIVSKFEDPYKIGPENTRLPGSWNGRYPFLRTDEGIRICSRFKPIIYNFDGKDIKVKYELDFGKYTLPDDIRKKNANKEVFMHKEFNSYTTYLWNYAETCEHIVFNIIVEGNHNIVFIDKKTFEPLISNSVQISPSGIFELYMNGSSWGDNCILSHHTATKFLKTPKISKSADLLRLFNTVRETDNPVISIHYLKTCNPTK